MMLVVTGVGFLIHLYSSEYMKKDDGYHRFFAYLNLFCFAMLVLLMGDNMVVLFVGWEGVGLCSYLLIGFWFGEEKNAAAGKKAFIVNRIGDFGLILAMVMIAYYCGSLSWSGMEAGATRLLEPVKIWPIGNLSDQTLPAFLAKILIPHDAATGQPTSVEVYGATLVGLAIFLGLRRQERADPALHLAPRRHGRPHARLGAHPRGHHGHRRRLPGGAHLVHLRPLARGHGRRPPAPAPPRRSSPPPSASSRPT